VIIRRRRDGGVHIVSLNTKTVPRQTHFYLTTMGSRNIVRPWLRPSAGRRKLRDVLNSLGRRSLICSPLREPTLL